MTMEDKVKILTHALVNSPCTYNNLSMAVARNAEAGKNPQTFERHIMWCTRCEALHRTGGPTVQPGLAAYPQKVMQVTVSPP